MDVEINECTERLRIPSISAHREAIQYLLKFNRALPNGRGICTHERERFRWHRWKLRVLCCFQLVVLCKRRKVISYLFQKELEFTISLRYIPIEGSEVDPIGVVYGRPVWGRSSTHECKEDLLHDFKIGNFLSVPSKNIQRMRLIIPLLLSVNALAEQSVEKHEFQAEMHRLMDIIINSLYSHKEVFLRELASNSHDAVEKARFLSLSDSDFLESNKKLEIRIEADADAKTLTITDDGVGMTKADLINNLGTVAKSGTTNFIEKMSEAGAVDSNLIGQFGVGFYSAFLVADKVTVVSKNNADPKQYIWESSAASSFTIREDVDGEQLGRGTRVILHMKEDALEFLNTGKIKELVLKFSQFNPFPIKVKVSKEIEEEVPDDSVEESKSEDKDDDLKVEEESEEKESKTKKIKKTVFEWEHINTAKPLWMRPRDNITEEEYTEFYKAISKDYDAPLAQTHFTAEGQTEFRSILFVPRRAPYNMLDSYHKRRSDVKLYVRRVMVADKLDEILPAYLGFVKGVVDSDDLPLNVNRDQLQHSKVLKVISKKLVKKVLDLLRDMAKEAEPKTEDVKEEPPVSEDEDDTPRKPKTVKEGEKSDWEVFYSQFSTMLKLGCYEDDANRERVAKLLRFNSWQHPSNLTSLDAYIKAAGGDDTKFIYYMSGESVETMQKSPALQAFKKRGLDVLLLHDNLDEPCLQRLTEYKGKKFVSIQKADVQLPETDEDKTRFKKLKAMYRPLTDWWKEKLSAASDKLGIKIENVVISKRLVDSPCVVVSSQWGHSAQQERVMKSQAFQQKDELMMMSGRKTLEINPNHPIIKDLLERVKANKEDNQAIDTASVLFQAAAIESGYDLSDPSALVAKMYRLMSMQLGVDPEAPVHEVEVPEGDVPDSESADEETVNFDSNDFGNLDDLDEDDDLSNDKDEL
jgi:heat shock protein beta